MFPSLEDDLGSAVSLKRNSISESHSILEGDNVLAGNSILKGDRVLEGNNILEGDNILKGNNVERQYSALVDLYSAIPVCL
jgi:hypothetical protein